MTRATAAQQRVRRSSWALSLVWLACSDAGGPEPASDASADAAVLAEAGATPVDASHAGDAARDARVPGDDAAPGGDGAPADAGPPETQLVSGPQGETPARDATIVVSASVANATFECSLDGEPRDDCSERTELRDLAIGTHTFRIAARDAAGRVDRSPLELTWTVIAEPGLRLRTIAVGYNHACAIDDAGALLCWGANAFGQLGLGDTEPRSAPVPVGAELDWEAVAAGRFHTCALRGGGALHCWGASAFGQAGVLAESVLAPSAVADSVPFVALATGDWHSCGLTGGGDVHCWGYNLLGRLGDGTGAGTEEDPEAYVAAAVPVDLPVAAVAISAGAAHSCAIDEDGGLWCWGGGAHGELGSEPSAECMLSAASTACSLTPILLAGAARYRAVCAGGSHSCAVDSEAVLRCWGAGEQGQLGAGDTQSSSEPLPVGSGYAAVACGGSHTCAVRENGELVCFGSNENGQLGFGDASTSTPVDTGGAQRWSVSAAGALGSCGLDAASAGYCWGNSAYAGTNLPTYIVPL